jgi:nucleoside-diphosphate-sugar epimerase
VTWRCDVANAFRRPYIVDWVHVDNFVHANVCAATAPRGDVAGQAFFISDGNPVNNFEFLRPYVEGLGRALPYYIAGVIGDESNGIRDKRLEVMAEKVLR